MKPIGLLRWSARLLSLLALGFLSALFLADGSFNLGLGGLAALTVRQQIAFGCFALLGLGLVIGWIWEAQGGALALMAVGGAYAFGSPGPTMDVWAIPALALPAVLFLAIGLYESMRSP